MYVSFRHYPRTDIAPAASLRLEIWQEQVIFAVNTNFPLRSYRDGVIEMSSTLPNIANHRRSSITGYRSHGIGNPFRREEILEVLGGFSLQSGLVEGGGKLG